MRTIQKIIDSISKTDYFTPWEDTLFDDRVIEEWHRLLYQNETEFFYTKIGEVFYRQKVPFVIVTEYVDEVFRRLEEISLDQYYIKNMIAQAYLNERLRYDVLLIEMELEKRLVGVLEGKRELINAHLRWMKAFIQTILGEAVPLELDATQCYVGRWIEKEEDSPMHEKIDESHVDLHAMAQSAIRMYRRNDFAYFLLLYNDILASSYQIRDIIMNIYFVRRVTTVDRDVLTDLPNYFQLKKDLLSDDGDHSLFIFNIKDFSKINMLYGHEIGDALIKEIMERLVSIDEAKECYRIYGDEFAIISPTLLRDKTLESFRQKIEEYGYHVKNTRVVLSFYGSVAQIGPHVLEHCEYGLIESKRQNGHITIMDDMDESMIRYANKITLSQKLRLAFMDDRILPYFQPIMNVNTGEITKYEALMRVQDLNGQILEPAYFLEAMQNMYIYPEVTKVMIQKTFDVFDGNGLEFSINLSFADIVNPETESFIIAMLKQYPETARRCTFELLEHETIHDHIEVNDFFDLLHSYGVKIALDDFGVGYSNYDTIFKFDIDYIKIDGSLTQTLHTDHKSKVLMESIVSIAKELGAKTIVEFVYDEELLRLAKEMDVDYVQGYYIARPSEQLIWG